MKIQTPTITNLEGIVATGFLRVAATTGLLSVDTSTYLTSLSGAVLTDQTVGQTIGATGARLTKLWVTDITVSNAITGSVTGNAGTVTNGIYTTSQVTALAAAGAGDYGKYLKANASTGALEWSTVSGSGASTALDNLASVAINTTLVSDTDNTDALGTAAISWSDLWLGNGSVITWSSAPSTADVTLTHSANALTLAGGDLIMATSLGSTGTRVLKGWFTDLEVTNAIAGSVTGNAGTASAVAVGGITGLGTGVATALAVNVGAAGAFVIFDGALGTPSSGTVTNLTGTASININGTVGATTPSTIVGTTITANTGLMPDANDGAYIGAAGTAFSDLFLASGGVINWDSGNGTITHSAGLLTINVPLSVGTGFRIGGAATAGKILVGDGTNFVASTPTFPNASATAGKFIRSDGTNWIASTPTLPTSAGTAGKVLTSDGTNYIESTPTFPNASATTRKIIVSDGTNWVASTETYAVPGTSGNYMKSDGTNWTSAAFPASSGISFSAQDIQLNATSTLVVSGGVPSSDFTSNATGTVMYTAFAGAGTTATILRVARDATTGNYYITHRVTLTVTASTCIGLAVVGNYLFVSTQVGGADTLIRYDAADLANVATFTFSGTARRGVAFGAGNDLYIANGSSGQFDRFTLSGTVATNQGAVTYTNGGNSPRGACCDGTSVWLSDIGVSGQGTGSIRKYVLAGGAASTTFTPLIYTDSLKNGLGYPGLFMAGTAVGIGFHYNLSDATAIIGIAARIMAVTI